MKISFNWLQDFVAFRETNPSVIAECLTEATAEVEEVEVQGALLTHCCVGNVLTIKKHPNADTLSLVNVQTDRGVKHVVCGGTNLREGMNIAFAHLGARVRWHGETISILEKVKVRGEESEGMICAAEELDLKDRFPSKEEDGPRPILNLGTTDESVGKPLRDVLHLNDTIFHINNHAITHRPDLFSHLGFARECVALGLAKWKKSIKNYELPIRQAQGRQTKNFPKNPLPFKVTNDIPTFIPRYCACLLHIDSLGETPQWMRSRLEALGWRSVSLPVDITNYVTAELGMPLHSFDAGDIHGDIHMRTSKKTEVITTLDDVDRALPEGAIVLSDNQGIFDLLGIMGGLRSSTKETTRNVYLHSAGVDPVSIRNTILAIGHRTEAATIYEKGIPPVIVEQGFFRALELFLDLVPGATITSKLESCGSNGTPKPIIFSLDRVSNLLGTTVPEQRIKAILTNLGFEMKRSTNYKPKTKNYTVTPPLWRLHDCYEECDVIEEIARVSRYSTFVPVMPSASITLPLRDQRLHNLRQTLAIGGYYELLPHSLVSPTLLKRCSLSTNSVPSIENPLSDDLSCLQGSTLPRLLEHAEQNLVHAEKLLRTFTIARVFEKTRNEHTELGLLSTTLEPTHLKHDPFLELKQDLSLVLESLDYPPSFSAPPTTPPYCHPGRTASVQGGGTTVGLLFEVHPSLQEHFGLTHRTASATVNLSTLFTLPPLRAPLRLLPSFPGITYDLTLTLSHAQSLSELLSRMKGKHTLLEEIKIHDIFEPPKGNAGRYNLTLRCTYRAGERTLTEEEAKEAHESITHTLQNLVTSSNV